MTGWRTSASPQLVCNSSTVLGKGLPPQTTLQYSQGGQYTVLLREPAANVGCKNGDGFAQSQSQSELHLNSHRNAVLVGKKFGAGSAFYFAYAVDDSYYYQDQATLQAVVGNMLNVQL